MIMGNKNEFYVSYQKLFLIEQNNCCLDPSFCHGHDLHLCTCLESKMCIMFYVHTLKDKKRLLL